MGSIGMPALSQVPLEVLTQGSSEGWRGRMWLRCEFPVWILPTLHCQSLGRGSLQEKRSCLPRDILKNIEANHHPGKDQFPVAWLPEGVQICSAGCHLEAERCTAPIVLEGGTLPFGPEVKGNWLLLQTCTKMSSSLIPSHPRSHSIDLLLPQILNNGPGVLRDKFWD